MQESEDKVDAGKNLSGLGRDLAADEHFVVRFDRQTRSSESNCNDDDQRRTTNDTDDNKT